jgi:hypothetical protein
MRFQTAALFILPSIVGAFAPSSIQASGMVLDLVSLILSAVHEYVQFVQCTAQMCMSVSNVLLLFFRLL